MQRETGTVVRNKKNEKAILITLKHMQGQLGMVGRNKRMKRLYFSP